METQFGSSVIRKSGMWTLFVLFGLSCAGSSSDVEAPRGLNHRSDPIYGTFLTDGNWAYRKISRAERLDTPHGVQGAVGALSIPNEKGRHKFSCSATLISRRHVVTAAHCVENDEHWGGKIPEGTLYISFPQEPEQYFQEAIGTRHRWDGVNGGGDDLAIFALQSDVPRDIVRNYPKVITGDVGSFITSVDSRGFVLTGFGLTGPDINNLHEDTKRRFGHAAEVRLNTSGAIPIIEIDNDPNFANLHKGDSGGALFGKDPVTNEYVLVGVNSAITEYPPYTMFAAFIGSSGGYDHDLRPFMGPDEDGDGILDALDNCPPSLCDAIGDGRSCTNARQIDSDGDGIGDICDICPTVSSSDDAHPNGRRVGPDCGCPGMDSDYLSCTKGSTVCKDNFAGTCLFDYDLGGDPLPGFCSNLTDSDQDGIPDSCDTCPHVWEPGDRNSNIHIEREYGVEELGDVCEGVPIYPFQSLIVPYKWPTKPPSAGKGGLGVDVQKLAGYPWLGEGSSVNSFQQNIGFRHCGCMDDETGLRIDADECAETYCRPSRARQTEARWRSVTISSLNGYLLPGGVFSAQFEAFGFQGTSTEMEDPFPPWEERDRFEWQSYDDMSRPFDPIQGDSATGSSHGLIASVVRTPGGPFTSTRDSSHDLRTSLSAVMTPLAVEMPIPLEEILSEARREVCMIVDCVSFISFPMKPDLPFPPFPVDPLAIVAHDGIVGMLLRDGGFADVTEHFDPLLVELLSSGDFVTLPAEEHTGALARAGLRRVGAIIPLDGADAMGPLQILDENGVIELKGTAVNELSPEELAESIQLRQSERAIYSATQDRIFIMGGSSFLRTFAVGSGQYRTVVLDRSPSSTIGGLAINAFTNRLYSLEIHEVDGQDMASIYEYELGTGSSFRLYSIPWTGTYEKTALIADTSDTLILMGSNDGKTESWRLLHRGGAVVESLGKRVDEGVLFNEPHHASRSAVLRLGDELLMVEINHRGFIGGDALERL